MGRLARIYRNTRQDCCLGPDDDLRSLSHHEDLPEVYRAYQRYLQRSDNVDFGDLGHQMITAGVIDREKFTQVQAAKALGISTSTADRHWAYARAWLHQEVIGPDAPS